MALKDLTKEQYDFLVLTSESGSPYHPFVPALRRMLELPEQVGPNRGKILPPTESDRKVILHHHEHPAEQTPLHAPRIEAIEALLK